PVPEPTVRDLSVPQAKAGRGKKSADPVKEPAPPDEVEIIPAREIVAATTAEVLGKKAEASATANAKADAKTDAEKKDGDKPAEPRPEPVVTIADGSVPAAPVKPK